MICDFKNEYFFLSNFYLYDITYEEITYTNNISAFCAQFYNNTRKKLFAKTTPHEAIRLFNNKKHDFELSQDEQLDVMERLCELKFAGELQNKLLATETEELLYITDWKDKFWGIYDGEGENHLGKILMKIRHNIETKNTIDESKDITEDTTENIINDVIEEMPVDFLDDVQDDNIEDQEETNRTKNGKKKNKK